MRTVLTLAQAFSGHAHFATAGLYIMAQLLGAVAGALGDDNAIELHRHCTVSITRGTDSVRQPNAVSVTAGTLVEALIIPGYHIGHNKHAVPSGCFAVSTTCLKASCCACICLQPCLHRPSADRVVCAQIHDVSSWRLLVLEFVFTFFFLAVLYGTAVGTSGNGFTVLSPLAAGLAIYVSIEAIGPYTGAPLNPARLIGPAVVFFCNWRHFWVWLAGAFRPLRCRVKRKTPLAAACTTLILQGPPAALPTTVEKVWFREPPERAAGELLAAVAAAAFAAGTFGVGDAVSPPPSAAESFTCIGMSHTQCISPMIAADQILSSQYSDNQATLDRHVGEQLGERLMPDRSSV